MATRDTRRTAGTSSGRGAIAAAVARTAASRPPSGPARAASSARDLTPKGQQTRQRIVIAAARLMAERGVATTTLDHVRAAAGVSSSQIYHYFADKDALVLAVIEYQNEAIVSVHETVFANLDSVAGLRAWRDYIVNMQRRMQCTGGCPLGTLGSEIAETDQHARVMVAAGFTRWEKAIRGGYETMRARGVLPDGVDPAELATATLAALQGGLLLSQIQRSTVPLEAALDMTIAHVTSLVGTA
jgi:AcrR family transcriptional regulator